MKSTISRAVRVVLSTFYAATLVMTNVYTLHSVSAQEVSQTEQATPIVPPEPSYTYNESTGLWENGTYAWNPDDNTTTPLTQTTYSFNPSTSHWDSTEWVYDPIANSYVSSPATENTPPSPALSDNTTVQPNIDENPLSTSTNEPAGQKADKNNNSALKQESSVNTNKSDGYFDGFYDRSISVTVAIDSSANSGNALVIGNTVAGSATSGLASAQVNHINIIQSTISTQNGSKSPMIHTMTLQGGYVGDIVLGPENKTNSENSLSPNATIAVSNDTRLTNDITVTAQSGTATVSGNTSGGDATTGDAYALANLLNIVNSSIGAQESFIAILNILGDFEGDVLLPPELQKDLSHAQLHSGESPANSSLDFDTKTAIQTDISANAQSGLATVENNTEAGNAESGSAQTHVKIYNLAGKHIVAKDAVLVYVNVMGEWFGFITNAPAGSSSALLTSDELAAESSMNPQSEKLSTISDKTEIQNTISVRARTGDASVNSNTSAGNASSGDALALVNVVNMSESSLSLSGWFAVMFINIMGNWHGSFGTDTAYGGYQQDFDGSVSEPSEGPTTTTSVQSQIKMMPVIVASSRGSQQQQRRSNITTTPDRDQVTNNDTPDTATVNNESGSTLLGTSNEPTSTMGASDFSARTIVFSLLLSLLTILGIRAYTLLQKGRVA